MARLDSPELEREIDKIVSNAITADIVDGRYGSKPYTKEIISLIKGESDGK